MDKQTILVTGGSGYIASWVIHYLLEDGHTVRATIRDKSNQYKIEHLKDLEKKYSNSFEIFESDLLVDGSFDSAVDGCDIVMHTASPFLMGGIKNPQKQLVDPALKGTRNVLDSVNRFPKVKRVVLTSSIAAIYGNAKEALSLPDNTYNESHWNTLSSLTNEPYKYSKTLAEKEAWKMHESQDNWDLFVINPGFVLGPPLSKRTDSASIQFGVDIVKGKFKAGIPDFTFSVVDVRDVARAHINAAFTDSKPGRHIAVAKGISALGFMKIIDNHFKGSVPVPKKTVPKILMYLIAPMIGLKRSFVKDNVGYPHHFDNTKIKKNLSIEFLKFEKTIVDQIQYILDNKLQ
ncbi:MAG: diaminohydroxyphosphoribosylaminopyrimidine deaminase [Candidatus Marinimicrobia bacterium]|nr:diaminohydroxyphosphoribosylaminopyrimidine deaminase [Candidatus Neomarinimicrobiota bacterium]|tara:strand:- start:3020 stop:4060 length:1041 start_codon:yes stop_codon:yes gene_type:complete